MEAKTQFQTDLKKSMLFNNDSTISKGIYNLLVSTRDVKLYSKGLKPHRGWRIGDVKRYFGVKGNASEVIKQLENLKSIHTNLK